MVDGRATGLKPESNPAFKLPCNCSLPQFTAIADRFASRTYMLLAALMKQLHHYSGYFSGYLDFVMA
jgi:hypothetical protein